MEPLLQDILSIALHSKLLRADGKHGKASLKNYHLNRRGEPETPDHLVQERKHSKWYVTLAQCMLYYSK